MTRPAGELPASRLAGFYFFYYATVGAFMPYWAPYLEARGFSAIQMGVAFALMGLSRSIMPVVWGIWADISERRIAVVRGSAAVSLVLFLSIPFVDGLWWIAALMLAYSLFWHALLPQFEVVALNHLARTGGDYSRVRLWGSVGFVFAVLSLGPLLDQFGMLPLPFLVGTMWVGMVVTAWQVPDAQMVHGGDHVPGAIWAVLRRPEVLALLGVCLASQMSFAPYYNFFTLFLERHGYSRGVAGVLWALGVTAEIGLFWVMRPVIQRVGARRLMLAALATTALRWAVIGVAVDSWLLLVLAQISHALTFGAYHAVAVHYIQRMFPSRLQGRGQAIYNAVAYGVGGSIGSLASGWMWDAVSPEATFLTAALVALLGFWLGWRRLPA
ncbi:MFS transporter [Flagellatimonas centrodinii]|uniref:MFS transporter n=1 Tax=Flagellatimonas centrodinii TaxID=2806210 RepID=UPI001FEFF1FB|nr:MFS transporter [Flagellatimonas centrodinii]ULQ46431.1 MFS transporter [Flagellatimonas centrodinii]